MKKVKLTTITLALIASSAVAPLAANAEEVVSFDAVTEEGTAAEVEEEEEVAPAEVASFVAPAPLTVEGMNDNDTYNVTHPDYIEYKTRAEALVNELTAAFDAVSKEVLPTAADFPFVAPAALLIAAPVATTNLAVGGPDQLGVNYKAHLTALEADKAAIAKFNSDLATQRAVSAAQKQLNAEILKLTDASEAAKWTAKANASAKIGEDPAVALAILSDMTGGVSNLAQLKEDAKVETQDAFAAGIITENVYNTVIAAINAAEGPVSLAAAMAPVKAAIKLETRKGNLKIEIQYLNGTGSLLAGDAIALQLELAAADTKEKVDAVEAKMAAARELQKAKDAGYEAITTLVSLGAIKPARAAYYKDLISKARTPEEVEAILAAAAKDDNVIFDKAVAEEILHVLHKDGLITDADYTLYLLDLSEAKDEATVANIVTNARNIAAAREAAKATLLDALAANKITKEQYENAMKRIDAARYQSDIDAILAEYGLKADDTKPEPKPEPGTDGKDDADKNDEGKNDEGKNDEGKAPGKDDEGKAPGKDNNGSKPAVVTTTAKATLPQTGEELNGSIVAGGLMSMLTAAFLFFRRDRKAD